MIVSNSDSLPRSADRTVAFVTCLHAVRSRAMRFTEEHQQLRRTVRDFVEKEVNPSYEEWEKAGVGTCVFRLPPTGPDEALATLDQCTEVMRRFA